MSTLLMLLKNCIPFLMLSVLLQTNPSQQCFFSPTYKIRVINNLYNYQGTLRAHCASKDNDLGYKRLSLFGEFKWSFCESVLGNTLFFCHLWWESNEGWKEKAFDVFKSSWSRGCFSGVCTWEAREDGIYFTGYNPPEQWQFRYNWEHRLNGTV